MLEKFTRNAHSQLKYYVYLYIDPRNQDIFYIGKGLANRAFTHLSSIGPSIKAKRIREIRRAGFEPIIEILKYGLSEKESLLVEATAIDLVDIEKLTNEVRGHGSRHGARDSISNLTKVLNGKVATIKEPGILINVAQQYYHGMSAGELYDETRSAWKLGIKREKAKYAFSLHAGIIREVYRIVGWFPGWSTLRSAGRNAEHKQSKVRWEFVGCLADEEMRKYYIGRSAIRYFKPGAQNPIKYVNI